MAKKKLGQGIDFLFNDSVEEQRHNETTTLRISLVEPNKNQPRRDFDENAIIALADSIRQHGVLQPLLVRPLPNGSYQIVAGERRWRAARMAGLGEVPVVIRELDDRSTAQAALIENLQREDLNPIEEAIGYKGLMEEYNMTQNEVAQTVGRSRAAVANAVRLLELADEIKESLKNGDISVGHAKVILSLPEEERLGLAKEIADKGLTVRQAEKSALRLRNKKEEENSAGTRCRDESFFTKPSVYSELEIALSSYIGQKVVATEKKDGTAELKITFDSADSVKSFAKHLSDVWDK